MMAAEKAGVKRYIMLSSMLSLDVDSWKKIPELEDYLAALICLAHHLFLCRIAHIYHRGHQPHLDASLSLCLYAQA